LSKSTSDHDLLFGLLALQSHGSRGDGDSHGGVSQDPDRGTPRAVRIGVSPRVRKVRTSFVRLPAVARRRLLAAGLANAALVAVRPLDLVLALSENDR